MATDRYRGISLRIIAFAAFSVICYFGATVIITLVLAILVAYLLEPLVSLLRRWRLPRPLAIAASMLVAGILLGGVAALFIDRGQQFSENFPRYSKRIQRVTYDIRRQFLVLQKKSEDIGKTILPTTEQKPLIIQEYATWRDIFFRNLGPVYEYLIIASFFPFLVYFLLLEKEKIRFFVASYIGAQTKLSNTYVQGTSDRIVSDISDKIRGFVLGYLWSTLILLGVSWAVFFAFRVKEAFFWAVIYTVLSILPFVGAILSNLPPVFVAIIQFESVKLGIAFVTVCFMIHLIYANWLIPRTMGPRTALSPLIVVIAMMYWGFLWGAIGIFLAVPITATLRSVWIQYNALQYAPRPVTAE